MSSTGVEPSDSLSGMSEKSNDRSSSHIDVPSADFSRVQAMPILENVRNGGEVRDVETDERSDVLVVSSDESKSKSRSPAIPEAHRISSEKGDGADIVITSRVDETNREKSNESGSGGHVLGVKKSPLGLQIAECNEGHDMESEKQDSAAASAGSSSPPSSAEQDELQMDIDAKEESDEDDNKRDIEKEEQVKETLHEKRDVSFKSNTSSNTPHSAERDSAKVLETPPKESDEAMSPFNNKEEVASAKRVLPKWMVQDADAPPSPKEDVADKEENTANTPSSGVRGRGRGKKGRDSSRTVVKLHNEAVVVQQPHEESFSSGRPRRSTRSNVDYAHPDVATVVAEQEDLENELQQKVTRGRGRGRGRISRAGRSAGHKRAVDVSDGGEDSGSDYGAGKRQKKAAANTSARGKGRGRGSGRGKPQRSATRKSKKDESDEEDEEMDLDDDDVVGSGGSADVDEESYKPTPSKRRAAPITPQTKQPPKKRGRPSIKQNN